MHKRRGLCHRRNAMGWGVEQLMIVNVDVVTLHSLLVFLQLHEFHPTTMLLLPIVHLRYLVSSLREMEPSVVDNLVFQRSTHECGLHIGFCRGREDIRLSFSYFFQTLAIVMCLGRSKTLNFL